MILVFLIKKLKTKNTKLLIVILENKKKSSKCFKDLRHLGQDLIAKMIVNQTINHFYLVIG